MPVGAAVVANTSTAHPRATAVATRLGPFGQKPSRHDDARGRSGLTAATTGRSFGQWQIQAASPD